MTEEGKKPVKRDLFFQKLKRDQTVASQRVLMESVFNDMYKNRYQIYRLNFVRGLFFGLGSALGATLLLALLVWMLAQLGTLVPFLSDFIQQILDALGTRAT